MLGVDAVRALWISVALAADPSPLTFAPVTLEVANRPVFTFRATSAGIPPAARLSTARERLEAVPLEELGDSVTVRHLQLGPEGSEAVFLGPRFLFQVIEGDVDPAAGETTKAAAERAAAAPAWR